jgi:hypothetical protein
MRLHLFLKIKTLPLLHICKRRKRNSLRGTTLIDMGSHILFSASYNASLDNGRVPSAFTRRLPFKRLLPGEQ